MEENAQVCLNPYFLITACKFLVRNNRKELIQTQHALANLINILILNAMYYNTN